MNTLPPFKGFNIRIPIMLPTKGRVFINQGSTLLHPELVPVGNDGAMFPVGCW